MEIAASVPPRHAPRPKAPGPKDSIAAGNEAMAIGDFSDAAKSVHL
jgi:hypothetical protein